MMYVTMERTKLISLTILTLFEVLFCLPLAGFTQESPEMKELNQKAQHAYIDGRYAEAVTLNLEIAEKYPESNLRRYSVQMLGTLYENNLVDIKKAMKWDREYLEKYAGSRQVRFYKEKLASLEKLMEQEQAFKTYQAVRFAREGDEVKVKKFEALLKDHPDFSLKAEVHRELGFAYARMDKRRESYLAFQAMSQSNGKKLSSGDRQAYVTAGNYWQMTSFWGGIAWAVIVILWAVALLMKPWKQLTLVSIKKFLLWPVLWIVLAAAGMPTFYSLDNAGDTVIIHDTQVYIAAGLNLAVLFWLLLLTRGRFWHTRPRALRWLSPAFTLMMTTAVLYLFIIYQSNGTEIIDYFTVKYRHWIVEWGLL
jgi:tetratricopeptide (TPR) repeat protein